MDRFTVDPTLAVTTRPRGGDWLSDEPSELCRARVDVLVSCLTPSEEHEFELSEEADLATNAGMEFIRAPIADFGVPADPRAFDAMLELLLAERRRGASIAVHCRQGIGRSPLVVASVLVREGETPERAWIRIAHARRRPVPDTDAQRAWLELAGERWPRSTR